MDRLRHRSLHLLATLFAMLIFTGDLVADAISDASGITAQTSQNAGDDDTPMTACAVHVGAAIFVVATELSGPDFVELEGVSVVEEDGPAGVRAAIDLPPQLA